MVNFAKHLVDFRRNVKCVIDGACRVQQNHACDENGQCEHVDVVRSVGSFDDERYGCKQCKDHRDEMSQGTARVFDFL